MARSNDNDAPLLDRSRATKLGASPLNIAKLPELLGRPQY
jgi:hypothetical protein